MAEFRFPEDYFIKELRGELRTSPGNARKALLHLVHVIELRIRARRAHGQPVGREFTELAAIAVLIEFYEKLRPPSESGPAPKPRESSP